LVAITRERWIHRHASVASCDRDEIAPAQVGVVADLPLARRPDRVASAPVVVPHSKQLLTDARDRTYAAKKP
jgi:hypothetical protein